MPVVTAKRTIRAGSRVKALRTITFSNGSYHLKDKVYIVDGLNLEYYRTYHYLYQVMM